MGNSTIKNEELFRQIDKKTADDKTMRKFLKTIIGYGNIFSYKKKYEAAVNEALKDKEYIP